MRTAVPVLLILVAAITLAAAPASATLHTLNWKTTGDGLLTYDDATGLYWLDLTESNGLSRDAINGGANGIIADGFTWATMDQVGVFWNHGGLPLLQETDDPNDFLSTPSTATIETFLSQIGQTGPTSGTDTWFAQAVTVGTAQNCPGLPGCPYQTAILQRSGSNIFMHLVDGGSPEVSSDASGNVAHWLVSVMNPTPVEKSTWGAIKDLFKE
jgi:hypothetical protein